MVRAAPAYLPVVQGGGSIDVQRATTLSLEGLHFRNVGLRVPADLSTPADQHGRFARLANCSFEFPNWYGSLNRKWNRRGSDSNPGDIVILALTPEGKPGEIGNCWIPYDLYLYGVPNGRTANRNSVVGQLVWGPLAAGPQALDLDGCLVWKVKLTPNLGSALSGFYKFGLGTLPRPQFTVTSRQTLWETNLWLWENPQRWEFHWQGARNAYRVATRAWQRTGTWNCLAGWRQAHQSKEDGSVEADALLYDPRQWRLLPGSPGHGAGPNGKDAGADVDGVAQPPARPQP
jgi:hypothetical protein